MLVNQRILAASSDAKVHRCCRIRAYTSDHTASSLSPRICKNGMARVIAATKEKCMKSMAALRPPRLTQHPYLRAIVRMFGHA